MTLNGLPNDVLSNLDPFALIILIPVCDLLVSSQLSEKQTLWDIEGILVLPLPPSHGHQL